MGCGCKKRKADAEAAAAAQALAAQNLTIRLSEVKTPTTTEPANDTSNQTNQ
jgi:hypothetical protein